MPTPTASRPKSSQAYLTVDAVRDRTTRSGQLPAPPFFIWHTAEDSYVPPEHSYRLATALAAHGVGHTLHVFEHGQHSLGLAAGAGETSRWTELAAAWLHEHAAGAGP